MLDISRERPGVLQQGSVNVRCEADGCDSKKTWTRPVVDGAGERVHLCVPCLGRMDGEGLLVMAPPPSR